MVLGLPVFLPVPVMVLGLPVFPACSCDGSRAAGVPCLFL